MYWIKKKRYFFFQATSPNWSGVAAETSALARPGRGVGRSSWWPTTGRPEMSSDSSTTTCYRLWTMGTFSENSEAEDQMHHSFPKKHYSQKQPLSSFSNLKRGVVCHHLDHQLLGKQLSATPPFYISTSAGAFFWQSATISTNCDHELT